MLNATFVDDYTITDMKDFITNRGNLRKVEFWAATTFFLFAIFSLVAHIIVGGHPYNLPWYEEFGLEFDYYENYFLPLLFRYAFLYLAFLFLNLIVVPRLLRRESPILSALGLLLTFIATWVVLSTTDTWLKNHFFILYGDEDTTYGVIFQQMAACTFLLSLALGLYTLIRECGLYLLTDANTMNDRHRILIRDGLAAFGVWIITFLLFALADAENELILGWSLIIPFAILLYGYSFYRLIPRSRQRRWPLLRYLVKIMLLLAVAFVPMMATLATITQHEDTAAGIILFNTFFQLLITAPVSWMLFKRQIKGEEEVTHLQKELGQSHANLGFLRSQINPHFLFNALNTLYGTALQEGSERTAQGIQMLGDMMRFMLHENHQHKILLSREIDYLRNYIELQSLRTSSSPNITIETRIEDVSENKFIAPMLLIPFVENAFKHGISLQRKSWIRISLHTEGDTVYFDVYNSTHTKHELDPERDKSGIGLENVRQRLALLYPDRHELVIRQTPLEEFFVHLTVRL